MDYIVYFNHSMPGGDKNKVSIMVPTLSKGSQADHLLKLEKLLSVYLPNQTYVNYEVIVLCDGPNEMVESMIASLKDERIKLYSTETTMGKWGHPQTRRGVDIAIGDFFVRMNDDNKPYRCYLQSLVNALTCDAGISYGRVVFKGEARKAHNAVLYRSFIIPGDKKGELKSGNIDCMCYLVKMELAKKYIKYWDDTFAADWCFLKALLTDGIKVKFIDRIIGEKF